MQKTKIIFIGGVPGSGKTTLSKHISLLFNIDKVINLDLFKQFLSPFLDDNTYFNTTTHNAYKIENLDYITGFKKHSESVLNEFIKYKNILKKESILIIEGAQLTPDIIYMFSDFDILYFNLNGDKDSLIYRYNNRTRQSNWIENIDCILSIQEYLSKFDVIQVYNNNINLDIIKNFINNY